MRRPLERVGRHVPMATPTGSILASHRPYRVRFGVDAVTVRTRQVRLLVRAPRPTCPFIGSMALQTQAVLQRCLGIASMSEIQDRLAFDAVRQNLAVVFPTRAVAGFALKTRRWFRRPRHREGRTVESGMSVHGPEHLNSRERLFFIVASEAAIGTPTGVLTRLQLVDKNVVCPIAGRGNHASEHPRAATKPANSFASPAQSSIEPMPPPLLQL